MSRFKLAIRSIRKVGLSLSLILLVNLLLTALWWPLPTAQAAQIVVTSTSDGTGGPGCTLRDAITSANTDTATGGCPAGSGADTIVLAAGATYTFNSIDNSFSYQNANALPVITTGITVEGNGAIIERNSAIDTRFRLFYVDTGGNLILDNLIVRNGNVFAKGGGLYITASAGSASATIANSTFINNNAAPCYYPPFEGGCSSSNGGGIHITSSSQGTATLNITNSTFSNNTAYSGDQYSGGGVYSFATIDSITQVSVSSSTFRNNSQDGIFNDGNSTTLIDASIFDNNNFAGFVNKAKANITDSTFSNNSTFSGSGSGIFNSGDNNITTSNIANLSINHSLISSNNFGIYNTVHIAGTANLNITDSTISDNAKYGIYSEDNTGVPPNQTQVNAIVNRSAISNNGVGVVSYGAWGNASLKLLNSTISNSGSVALANYSAATDNTIGTANLEVANSTISNNQGIGISSLIKGTGDVTIINSTISNNVNQGSPTNDAGGIEIKNSGTGITTGSIRNTFVANNTGGNCAISLVNGTHNLEYPGTPDSPSCGSGSTVLTSDPLLGPLSDNGGPTQTRALLPGSPAINAGDNTVCAAPPINNLDQRGIHRTLGLACDIGAFEANVPPTINIIFNPSIISPGGMAHLKFNLSNPDSIMLTNVGFTDVMPNQVQIAATPNLNNGCGSGTISAISGSSNISISGVTLGSSQSCTIQVDVISSTLGNWSNTTGIISADETGAGTTSNTIILKVVNFLLVTTTADDAATPPAGSLRQAVAEAGGQGGAIVSFDPALGTNPQINLVAPLLVPANVLIQASCTNRVRLNATFANPIQLSGGNYLQGLQIFSSVMPVIKARGGGNELKCTSAAKS